LTELYQIRILIQKTKLLLSFVQIPLAHISRKYANHSPRAWKLLACTSKSHAIHVWKLLARISRRRAIHAWKLLACISRKHAIHAWKLLVHISRRHATRVWKPLAHISRRHVSPSTRAWKPLARISRKHATHVWKLLVGMNKSHVSRSGNSLTKPPGGEISSLRSLYAWHNLIAPVLRAERNLMPPMLVVRKWPWSYPSA